LACELFTVKTGGLTRLSEVAIVCACLTRDFVGRDTFRWQLSQAIRIRANAACWVKVSTPALCAFPHESLSNSNVEIGGQEKVTLHSR
jgi:hypothetical protein